MNQLRIFKALIRDVSRIDPRFLLVKGVHFGQKFAKVSFATRLRFEVAILGKV